MPSPIVAVLTFDHFSPFHCAVPCLIFGDILPGQAHGALGAAGGKLAAHERAQLVAQLAELLRLSNTLPPMGNTLVSNVPGPKEHLYLKGARMEEMHPISTLPPSNLLNITLFSYAGQLFFGLIATDELPNLQRLGDYVQEAFTELETSVRDAHAP